MNRTIILLSAFINLFSLFSNGQDSVRGNLVIVGGGLEADNKSIFQQLISMAGGADKATFAIIPSAGGAPMQSFVYFKNILVSYGLNPLNIHLIPVAVIDDDSTKDVNESEWKDNGNDLKLAELVRKCSAVWFSGGDQLRTTRTLYRPDGSQTPVLKAVWDVYRRGGVLGGTSAGAAIMSQVMIGAGTSIAALKHGVIRDFTGDDFPEDSGVLITKGLGFFPCGLVDQHFNTRARIGRLALALLNEKIRLGFGVDENTALIYHGQQGTISVAGASGITILDASNAKISIIQNKPSIKNLSVSYLQEGDFYNPATGKITPAEGKQSIKGREHRSGHYATQAGTLAGVQDSFQEILTSGMGDNKENDAIECLTLFSNTSGYMLTLRKTDLYDSYYGVSPSKRKQYTVARISMDVTPVKISVKPIK